MAQASHLRRGSSIVVLSGAKNLATTVDDDRGSGTVVAVEERKTSNVKTYFVYIMTNNAKTLYTGVTSNLPQRVLNHKIGATPGFTSKYRLTSLVYYESTSDVPYAIAREKQIKGWLRRKKIDLIESMNPYWFDLSDVLLGPSSNLEPDSSLRSERQAIRG